jgi:hypothetical protein
MIRKITIVSTLVLATTFSIAQNYGKTINPLYVKTAVSSSIKTVNIVQEKVEPKRKCATPTFNESNIAYETWIADVLQKENQFANAKKTSVVYNIPVIFHIIHSGQSVGSGYNISQAQVNSQITTLNQDFRKTNSDFSTTVTQTSFINAAADCEINFCAAKVSPTGAVLAEPGIERISTVTKGWTSPPYSGMSNSYIEGTIKPGSSWDPTKYLNIWILAMNDGVLGYAQFPTVPASTPTIGDMNGQGGAANTDGVVFDYTCIGNTGTAAYPFNKGRTATHEIGHWLGLYHIDGDSGCGNDYCSDTPAQSSLTSGCPSTTGGTSNSGCAASPNPPGKMYQNYMDYSDDRCLSMFTTNQKSRIQACMQYCTRRTSLNISTVCSTSNSIEESVATIEMSIYPNPTNGELFVNVNVLEVQDFTIEVINTLGQTVKELKQVQSNGGTFKMDLSDKNAGVYFVILKSKSISKTKRIILQ